MLFCSVFYMTNFYDIVQYVYWGLKSVWCQELYLNSSLSFFDSKDKYVSTSLCFTFNVVLKITESSMVLYINLLFTHYRFLYKYYQL